MKRASRLEDFSHAIREQHFQANRSFFRLRLKLAASMEGMSLVSTLRL